MFPSSHVRGDLAFGWYRFRGKFRRRLNNMTLCWQQTIVGQDYSSDLQQVQEQLRTHRKTHQEVTTFRAQIDRCISDRVSLLSLTLTHFLAGFYRQMKI